MNAFLLVLGLHGSLMLFDEFMHRRRVLPRWERWGHVIDSLSVALPIGLMAFLIKTEELKLLVIGLMAFSSLFVTKDEFVHQRFCKPMEQWVHALLFLLHPMFFYVSYQIWGQHQWLLKICFIGIILFAIYQLVYWNYVKN